MDEEAPTPRELQLLSHLQRLICLFPLAEHLEDQRTGRNQPHLKVIGKDTWMAGPMALVQDEVRVVIEARDHIALNGALLDYWRDLQAYDRHDP